MEYKFLYQDLLNQLRKRIPQNSELVTKLMDILPIEKMAVYRRLRQEVPFTFEEIVAIAKEFNISLDNMLGVDARTTLPFRIQSTGGVNPVEIDYLLLEEYVQTMKQVAASQNGEISLVTNLLPQSFYTGFNLILRFYYFKWQYYSIPADQTKPYHEIIFPDHLVHIANDIFTTMKNIKTGSYILDNQVFQKFINDIAYFNSIHLIKNEDVFLIKEELFRFIDYMENVATKGFADNPENKVYIYISDTSIDTSYCYIDCSKSCRFAIIRSFIFNSILTFEEETLEMMKHWIRSKIRTSTLLSVAGEKNRTLYFEAQRKFVEEL